MRVDEAWSQRPGRGAGKREDGQGAEDPVRPQTGRRLKAADGLS